MSLPSEVRWTLRIGGPLALGELGWMSTYIVDAIMIGRMPHSALPIAASFLGNTIYYAIVFFVIYLMNGLETLVAQAWGRGDAREGIRLLGQSMWIVVLGTPVTAALTLGAVHLLPLFHTPPEVITQTHIYLRALVWSTPPLLLYMALRRYLQSVSRVLLISISLITAGLVNWLCDYTLIFGHLGAPALGLPGSAWGTLLVRSWMLLLLLVGTLSAFRASGDRLRLYDLRLDWPRLKALLRIGWPSGLEFSTELGMATFMALLCSRLGTVLLAANQVVLDLNAFVYQVPAGLSYAAMIRVGQAAGRDDAEGVRRATRACLALGMGFIFVAAAAFVGFAPHWANLYTNDPNVAAAAVPIFLICGFSQLGDAAFVIFSSSLTGLGDTRAPMIVSLLCNWALGMPLAYLLTFRMGLGLHGLWIGRTTGSLVSAVALAAWWQWTLHRHTAPTGARSLAFYTHASAAK